MKGLAAIVVMGGMLAACSGTPAADNAATANTSGAATNVAARDPMEDKINALNDVQRKVAFYRAILDADFTCKKVVKYESKPRDENRPVWLVTCDDQGEYTITLQPNGIFSVSGVQQPRPRFPKATALPPGVK
jgi:hypothetical protein